MRIAIVGNGVAGIEAAFAARARNREAAITVISDESDYFFSRTALMYAFMDRLDRRDLEPHERHVWKRERIDRVRARVIDLDAREKTLRLNDGRSIAYDRLLLATGSRPRELEAKGIEGTDGVVNFVTLSDLDRCESLVRSTKRAVVVGGGLIGVELVECLIHHGIAVTFLVREPWYFPAALGREEAAMVTAHLRAHGVDVILDDELASVERNANNRVSVVMTRKRQSIECQMLGVCVGVRPAIDWLRNVTTAPELGRGVLVDSQLRTSLPSVWAAGDCAELRLNNGETLVEQLWYSAKRQGAIAGENLVGASLDYRPPLFYNSARFFEIEYTTVGEVARLPPDTRAHYLRAPDREASVRIVHRDNRVIGFNLLGSRWDHERLQRFIEERRDLDWTLAHLKEAQFDVELGRLKLSDMTESELVYS